MLELQVEVGLNLFHLHTGLTKVSLVRCSLDELRSSFIKGLLSVKRLRVLNDNRSSELSLKFLSRNKRAQRDVTSGSIKKPNFICSFKMHLNW